MFRLSSKFSEESVLFLSVLKWSLLSSAVGLSTGALVSLFLFLLEKASAFTGNISFALLLLPPALALNAFLLGKFLPREAADSTDKLVAFLHRGSPLPLLSIPKVFFLSILTIASGGSAGKEAPAADMGGTVGFWVGKVLKLSPRDLKKLTLCGVSAGFAAVFGTPMAGALYGMELLFVGNILYEVFLPAFIAGILSHQVVLALGWGIPSALLRFSPTFSRGFFLHILLAGIVFGLLSFLFVEFWKRVRTLLGKVSLPLPGKAFLVGTLLALFGFFVSPRPLGLGSGVITETLLNAPCRWFDVPAKALFSALTLLGGGSGGVVTPLFYLGATSGSLLADLLSLDRGTFAALGLVGLLSGTTNTPIAAAILGVELFGPSLGPYAALVSIISFLMSGHRSLLPSQVLSLRKSSSLNVETGHSFSETMGAEESARRALSHGLWTVREKVPFSPRRKPK